MSRSWLTVLLLILVSACSVDRGSDDADRARPPSVPATSRLAGLLGNETGDDFSLALEPVAFEFPADHGPHPDFRNEWWYVTGNLDAVTGERFGFELTLFRFSLAPDVEQTASAWRTNQIFIGHFAVTDAARETFHAAQRYSRGAAGLAGAAASPFRVWLGDWRLEATTGSDPDGMPWRLEAADDDMALALTLTAVKPIVENGDNGLSQKSAKPGNASYYYSMPRLETEGRLRLGEASYRVNGLSWLDREWSSSALSADQAGWDWFALQLDDGRELMYYQLRKLDGSADRFSGGTFIRKDGSSLHLDRDDVRLEVLERWSTDDGQSYPIQWRLQVPSLELDLGVRPVIRDQELDTTVRYWEGAVDVTGSGGNGAVRGRGYVEMTGYAD